MADVTGLLAGLRGETAARRRRSTRGAAQGSRQAGPADADAGTRDRRRLRTTEGAADVKAAVMGAGSWGTTFAQVLCDAGHAGDAVGPPGGAGRGDQRAPREPRLPAAASRCPTRCSATCDPAEALAGADLVVLAVPGPDAAARTWPRWAPLIPAGALLVSLMKGIELGTCDRMSEVIAEVLRRCRRDRVAVVSGPEPGPGDRRSASTPRPWSPAPTQARPSSCRRPATHRYFRPYTNPDVIGCELGGAVKNVIALAVGMAVGMGLGDNTRAMLITRGLAETARLGAALGADQHTFAGPGRDGRPGRDLQLAAVPQPDVRREPGPRPDAGRGRGEHQADRRRA